MNLHSGYELTTQVIAALEAGGLVVGRAHAPTGSVAQGYVVVYPLTGGTFDGTLAEPYDDADASYQFTSVSSDARQCEWIADKVRTTILTATFTLTNRKVIQVDPVFAGGVVRDDDIQPPNFYSPERYAVWTTPA